MRLIEVAKKEAAGFTSCSYFSFNSCCKKMRKASIVRA